MGSRRLPALAWGLVPVSRSGGGFLLILLLAPAMFTIIAGVILRRRAWEIALFSFLSSATTVASFVVLVLLSERPFD
jgi:hypothetical protein